MSVPPRGCGVVLHGVPFSPCAPRGGGGTWCCQGGADGRPFSRLNRPHGYLITRLNRCQHLFCRFFKKFPAASPGLCPQLFGCGGYMLSAVPISANACPGCNSTFVRLCASAMVHLYDSTLVLCPLLAMRGHGLHKNQALRRPQTPVFIIFIHNHHLPIRIHHFSRLLPYFETFSHIFPISSPLHKYRSKHRTFSTKRSIFDLFFIKKYIKNIIFYLIFLLENVRILHLLLSFVVFLMLFSMFFRSPQLCTSIASSLRSPATTVTKQQATTIPSISFLCKGCVKHRERSELLHF